MRFEKSMTDDPAIPDQRESSVKRCTISMPAERSAKLTRATMPICMKTMASQISGRVHCHRASGRNRISSASACHVTHLESPRGHAENEIPEQSVTGKRILNDVPESSPVHPTGTRKLHDAAEGVSHGPKKPGRPIDGRGNIEVTVHDLWLNGRRGSRPGTKVVKEAASNVRDRRVADQHVAIEETRPPVPQDQRGPMTGHAERKENGQPDHRDQDAETNAGDPTTQHVGQDPVRRVETRSRDHACPAEQLRSP